MNIEKISKTVGSTLINKIGVKMNIDELRDDIQKRRLGGETYESIGDHFGISRSLVQYIEEHPSYNPGRNIKKKLGLETSSAYTRKRRERLNEIAKLWGYASWSNYETETIRTYSIK